MNFDDETLMAYADGELDADSRRTLEQAMAADPALAARVQQHEALRRRVGAAFDATLAEPVPERLLQALQAGAAGPAAVVDLAQARSRREQAQVAAAQPRRAAWGWARWGGMAASLLLGVVIGRAVLPVPSGGADLAEATMPARGALAQALNNAAGGSGNPDAKVSVRLSFIDRKGRYCRAFESTGQAGLACRDGATWQVQALVSAPAGSPPGAGMRQAASPLPPALLGEIDQRIAGEPLNAAAEQEARRKGWQR